MASVLSFLRSELPPAEPQCCSEEFLRDFRRSIAEVCTTELDWQQHLAEAETTATEGSDSDSVASCDRVDSFDSLETASSLAIVAVEDERLALAAVAATPRVLADVRGVETEEAGWEVLPGFDCQAVECAGWSLVA